MESEVLARDYGDRWVKYGLIDNLSRYNKPVLMVPSVVIPVEMNFLFNPFHRDYATSVSVGDPRQFTFDPRLVSAR
jgi:RES domain-containing protein